jgi:hypothetical protein
MSLAVQVQYRGELYYTTAAGGDALREPLVQRGADGLVLCWPRRRTWVHVSADGVAERVCVAAAEGDAVAVYTPGVGEAPPWRDADAFAGEMDLVVLVAA